MTIEETIEKYEAEVYGVGQMPAANKATLRRQLQAEDRFWERYEGREEEGHSHSAVGDWNGMSNQD